MFSAISIYHKRIVPILDFVSPVMLINNSLEEAIQYMAAAIDFVHNQLARSTNNHPGVCPFQFDMIIATGKPITRLQNDQYAHNHDDDDDDIDEVNADESKTADTEVPESYGKDPIGNIEDKLKTNGLKYSKYNASKTDPAYPQREFKQKLFNQFQKDNGITETNQRSYLKHKRLIALVDQKQNMQKKQSVPLYMYEPPENSRDIPRNALPEWYFGSSKLCLLPGLNGSDEESDNIGSHDLCGGAMLTLSCHVKEDKMVRAYLYYNGQCMRFMPEDIRTVLPLLFNMEYGNNKEWMKMDKDVNGYIEKMREVLRDEQFTAFQCNRLYL